MRIVCNRRVFVQGLSIAQRAITNRTGLPILSHVLLQADIPDTIKISATDLSTEIQYHIECEVIEPGCCTLPAAKLFSLLSSHTAEDVVIFDESTSTAPKPKIVCDGSKYELASLSPDEYPNPPEWDVDGRFFIPANKIIEINNRVGFAIAKDEARIIMTGALFEICNGRFRCVSTQGHNLAVYDVCEVSDIENTSRIIPGEALSELAKAIPNDDSPVEIAMGLANIQFTNGNLVFRSQVIQGPYANYNNVIPDDSSYTSSVIAPIQPLLAAVNRAKLLPDNESSRIRIDVGDNQLHIHTQSHQGNVDEIVEAVCDKPFKFAVSANYLISILRAISGDAIEMKFTTEMGPILCKPADAENYYVIQMPMERKEDE